MVDGYIWDDLFIQSNSKLLGMAQEKWRANVKEIETKLSLVIHSFAKITSWISFSIAFGIETHLKNNTRTSYTTIYIWVNDKNNAAAPTTTMTLHCKYQKLCTKYVSNTKIL